MARYLLCMTGASGAIYGIRLMGVLARTPGAELHLVASDWGERVVAEETGRSLAAHIEALGPARVLRHAPDDLAASVASGSFRLDAALVVPCSIATAGAISSGIVQNLVHRAAAVALKEGWPLVLVPRESPLSLVALRSLVELKEAGAEIVPASPGFYGKPRSIDDLVDQVVARVCDRIGVTVADAIRWKEQVEE
jgi:flavin prenyltransferase